MNSLWWLALSALALPIWWHRQRRKRVSAVQLATARFLPATDPRQLRVWTWVDRALLLLRCLMLFAVVAWLADLVVPWRGDTVLVAPGAEASQIPPGLARIDLPDRDALGWFARHQREWKPDAKVTIVGDIAMPAVQPRFARRVELRPRAQLPAPVTWRVVVAGEHASQWRTFFAAVSTPQRHIMVTDTPTGSERLIVWDSAAPPPAAWHAGLWWITHASAAPELSVGRPAPGLPGLRIADTPRGRLWAIPPEPPADAASARTLFDAWQRLDGSLIPYTAPAQQFFPAAVATPANGAQRDVIGMLAIVLFGLERLLSHVRRR